jgi:hypothetical protein
MTGALAGPYCVLAPVRTMPSLLLMLTVPVLLLHSIWIPQESRSRRVTLYRLFHE